MKISHSKLHVTINQLLYIRTISLPNPSATPKPLVYFKKFWSLAP